MLEVRAVPGGGRMGGVGAEEERMLEKATGLGQVCAVGRTRAKAGKTESARLKLKIDSRPVCVM